MIGIILVCIVAIGASHSEDTRKYYYARSAIDLRELALKDLKIIKELKRIRSIHDDPRAVNFTENYFRDFMDSTGFHINEIKPKEVIQQVNNPITMYRLIRRVVDFSQEAGNNDLRAIYLPILSGDWPLASDVADAIEGILRLQTVVNINVTELARGKVQGIQTNSSLRAIHCLEIANHATADKLYAHAHDWCVEALRLAYIDNTVRPSVVEAALSQILRMHDHNWNLWDYDRNNYFIHRISELQNFSAMPRTVRNVMFDSYHGGGRNCSYWRINYWALCSGNSYLKPDATSHLFCWLEFKIHKIYTIAPLKIEFLARNPDVIQIHEAFSDKEMDLIKYDAGGLSPSKVVVMDENSDEDSKLDPSRTSAQAYLNYDDTSDELINHRATIMTGLNLKPLHSREDAQVANYLPGGHYEHHVDALIREKIYGEGGDRIGTFMIYLNDVHDGGHTVFPTALSAAIPVRGSAVFWYSLFTDGTPDYSSIHGACPVVLGEKWVSNKWIRYNDQFLSHQCTLRQKERFRFPVNGKLLPVPPAFEHPTISDEDFNSCTLLRVPVTDLEMELSESSGDSEKPVQKYAYASSPSLKAAVRLDLEIFHNIKQSFDMMRENATIAGEQIRLIENYLQLFNHSTYNSLGKTFNNEEVDRLAGNPLAVFSTFWRFSSEQQHREILGPFLPEAYDPVDGPTKQDLDDAMTGIIRTQYVLDLKASDIAQGIIAGTDAGITLRADQCAQFGGYAMGHEYFTLGVDWMLVTLEKVKNGDASLTLDAAQYNYEHALKMHNKFFDSSEGWEPVFYAKKISSADFPSATKTRKKVQYDAFRLKEGEEFTEINYWGLCQGIPHQTANEKSKLFCWYEHEIHPTWKIRPLQAEILSLSPKIEIVQYHNLLTDAQIEVLKNHPTNSFLESSVIYESFTDEIGGHRNTNARLSAISWLRENVNASLAVSKLIEKVTGLKVQGQERMSLQVAVYTPGSHYSVHPDASSYDVDLDLTRIATFMFYLNDVQQGGGTAFSQAGVHVVPEKGSAVFWYNTYTSGDADKLIWHGACPVIFGEKWVANKWIHYVPQHKLRCDKEKDIQFEILVNGKSKYGRF